MDDSNPGNVTSGLGNDTFLDSEFRYTLFPVFYCLVFILGLLANSCVLFVLHHMHRTKAMNEVWIYMTNLTVADLLFVLALPFWISYYRRHGDWVYPAFLCNITGSLFFINTYCSVLFLTVISVNRYWAITRPLEAASSNQWRRGVIVSVVIWGITLAAAVNHLVAQHLQVDERTGIARCFEGYQNDTRKAKLAVAAIHFVIIGLFFAAFVLVVVCNVLIARVLLARQPSLAHSSTRPSGTKRRAMRMLGAVVAVFVVCFLPHHVVQGPWALAVLGLVEGWGTETRQRLNDAHQVTLLLMGLNCLLDPVVYCFATINFRKYIKDLWKKLRRGQACPNMVSTNITVENRIECQPLSDLER